MSQELEEGKSSYPDTSCKGQAQGKSVNIFAMYTQKSAEVIVGDLQDEMYGMSVKN
jgi:hypothetical protein